MTDLLTRVREALRGKWQSGRSPWEGLIRLYDADREAFYLLACEGELTDPDVEPLSLLARRIRKSVRSAYRLTPPAGGEGQVETASGPIPVPAVLFPDVQDFLLKIDGKGVSTEKGKDYLGHEVSEAEVRFKLGDPADAARQREKLDARDKARPVVFKVTRHDLDSLKNQPAYITHNLLKCVRKVVLAPTAVYRGLKRGDKAPKRLQEGWAICGKPNRACDNKGHPTQAPPGMVFMVYADSDGCVFDWDWVQEATDSPGHPLDPELRFGNPVPTDTEMVLDLSYSPPVGVFDSAVVASSPKGDCVFCYLTDAPSYAGRIHEDLTVFYDLHDREKITGFKIKNVQRILKERQALNLSDAPGLNVLILPILKKTLVKHHDVTIKLYELIIAALVDVKIPLPAPDESEAATASC